MMINQSHSGRYALSFFILLLFLTSCDPARKITAPTDDGIIEFVFLQANDVYEITPLQGGKVGGLARVATVRDNLMAKNKNTLTVHAGDFINPSLIGTIKYQGEKIKGKQMIEVMNAVPFDLVTFGNHEFDIDEDELQQRMNESNFEWTTCNTFQKCGDQVYPFYRMVNGRKHFAPETYTWEINDADGTNIKVGIFSVTLPVNEKDYVHYDDFYAAAKKAVKDLSATTDVVIGLTHLELEQDLEVAKQNQSVPLLMGGHDHDNMRHAVGNSVVTKADANAKTVYIHRLTYNKKTKTCVLKSELKDINESVAHHPEVAKIVEKWSGILMKEVGQIVDEPNKIIYTAQVPLDGRESSIRHKQTNLGGLVAESMYKAVKKSDAAMINSGSFRIDDQINGNVTALDFFRALPYGGKIINVKMTGALLKKILDAGAAGKGKGRYLQMYKVETNRQGEWVIDNKVVDDKRKYTIAMNDFMLAGYDFKFLTKDTEGILSIDDDESGSRGDLRVAIVDYLKSK